MQGEDRANFFNKYSIQNKTNNNDETILKDRKTGDLVLMKEIIIKTTPELKKMIETLEAQKYLKNNYLLSLINYEVRADHYNNENVIMHQLITLYHYSTRSLAEELQSRISNSQCFDETQIWSILCSLVFGLAYLQRENVGHGCISPTDIFLSQDGNVKIVDPSLASYSPFTLNEGYYYSPEMIERFNQETETFHYGDSEIDIYKSDMFSLGMCLLHCCLLQSCQDCYDFQNCEIIPSVLKEKFNCLVDYYNKDILNVLYEMLCFDVNRRPDFIQLQKYLQQSYLNQNQEKNMSKNNKIMPCQHDEIEISTQEMAFFENDVEIVDYPENRPCQEMDLKEKQETVQQIYKNQFNKVSFQNLVSVESRNEPEQEDKENLDSNQEQVYTGKLNQMTKKIEKSVEPASVVKINIKSSDLGTAWGIENYEPEPQQVYTDPTLLEMMRNDIAKILEKRKQKNS